ncbi:TlyA family RNA methyltransferase [Microlunatus antarcticus]|uniref:23S rRNA (Cytidine1920-2'-O)/16S rRNA (Cytidine1409-2'-O)-methyltransferase n=1 Tax=Microlunatus antarcticus TaxID=53388 RepID=A0A7W5P6B3_9ACTN|nr:TlyA family RNA methyltransferase [Microlunatus antarcticus]MBB3326258.1 23S rRNA (cytidine1920-2'-O)/16S rRNA (cytidine1409-2'-O)-methyltransferase [Microlunatus antarcticus]
MTTTPEPEATSETEGTAPPETPGTVPVRLDRALVDRGLARSRGQAAELIKAGRVSLDGRTVLKPSDLVAGTEQLEARTDPYVSRGAHKLAGALDDLGLVPSGRALDAGSSTGGFTQVLLERGVEEVYAVDVGTEQLAELLRADPRVHVHEQTSARDLTPDNLDGRPVDLVVADLSFISLTKFVDTFSEVTAPDGTWLLMVKPQFEVGRAALDKGGVVRNPGLHRKAVDGVAAAAAALGWHVQAVVASRLPGPAGNQEFFVHLSRTPCAHPVTPWP